MKENDAANLFPIIFFGAACGSEWDKPEFKISD